MRYKLDFKLLNYNYVTTTFQVWFKKGQMGKFRQSNQTENDNETNFGQT